MSHCRAASTCIKVITLLTLLMSAYALVNQKVTRVIDMNGPNVKQVTSIEFSGEAAPGESKSVELISHYIALVHRDVVDSMIFIRAKAGEAILDVTRSESDDPAGNQYSAFKISFATPIEHSKTQSLVITEEYVNRKVPYPKKMKLTDDPKVMFSDDGYYPSVYFTKKMKSSFEVGNSATVISATEIESGEIRGRSVRYGTYKNVEALKSYPILIYMMYNDPIPVFSKATRTVTVSHWKRVSVKEDFRLFNRITDLSGEFNRIEFNQWRTKYSINNFDCELPRETEGLYYVDEIGNITTSNAYRNSKFVKFMAEPRFPLLGGWQTYWEQGYSLPFSDHVTQEGTDTYKFEINFSHPYNDIVAEDFTFTIVIPQGAVFQRIEICDKNKCSNKNDLSAFTELPFEIDSISTSTVYGYLDLLGKTAISMKKTNVIEKHHDFKVSVVYHLSPFHIYFKPLLICFYSFVVVFFLLISYRLSSMPRSKPKVD